MNTEQKSGADGREGGGAAVLCFFRVLGAIEFLLVRIFPAPLGLVVSTGFSFGTGYLLGWIMVPAWARIGVVSGMILIPAIVLYTRFGDWLLVGLGAFLACGAMLFGEHRGRYTAELMMNVSGQFQG